MKQDRIVKWREAHPNIMIDHDVLTQIDHSCPSLSVIDFCSYLESKGIDPDIISFIRDLGSECQWVYGNWDKAQRDNSPGKLVADQINNCDGPEWSFTKRFLVDYAKANNIHFNLNPEPETKTWMQIP